MSDPRNPPSKTPKFKKGDILINPTEPLEKIEILSVCQVNETLTYEIRLEFMGSLLGEVGLTSEEGLVSETFLDHFVLERVANSSLWKAMHGN